MTLFEKILHRQIPATLVYEDDLTFAFRDIAPHAPTHVLVVPKKPLPQLSDATAEDEALLGRLFLTANRVAAQEGLTDFRVVVNNGAGAGQSVFHLHLHVLGGRGFGWPPG
jgi:histidine triad (HIT) family protein